MKRLLIISLVCCLACDTDVMVPVNSSPVREFHFNFETGKLIGQKMIAYNASGMVVSELYFSTVDPIGNNEVFYEYNSDGHLLRKKERAPNQTSNFFVTEFTYQDGQRKTETNFHDDDPTGGYRTIYFFTGSQKDSTQMYYFSGIEQKYIYMSTTYYEYDGLNVTRAFSSHGGETVYRYGEHVFSKCNVFPGDNGTTIEDCIDRESFDGGQVVKVFQRSPWSEQLQEEIFYNGSRIRERRLYSFPAYEPGNFVEIKQIKYGY